MQRAENWGKVGRAEYKQCKVQRWRYMTKFKDKKESQCGSSALGKRSERPEVCISIILSK